MRDCDETQKEDRHEPEQATPPEKALLRPEEPLEHPYLGLTAPARKRLGEIASNEHRNLPKDREKKRLKTKRSRDYAY